MSRQRAMMERAREMADRIRERRESARLDRILKGKHIIDSYMDAAYVAYGEDRNGVKEITYDETTGWYTVTYVNSKPKHVHADVLTAATQFMYGMAHEAELGVGDESDAD